MFIAKPLLGLSFRLHLCSIRLFLTPAIGLHLYLGRLSGCTCYRVGHLATSEPSLTTSEPQEAVKLHLFLAKPLLGPAIRLHLCLARLLLNLAISVC